MITSVGQEYSLLDDEPRFLRPRVDPLNASSSLVQKQKIVWSDSLQQDYKRRQERNSYTPYANSEGQLSNNRLIPRKRYIILRPESQLASPIGTALGQPARKLGPTQLGTTPIRTVNIPATSLRRTPITSTVRTISRTAALPQRNTQYVLKIPVVRNQYEPRTNLKRTVITQPRVEAPLMTMHIPTVPASMSMGGEYIEEEEIDEDDDTWSKEWSGPSLLDDSLYTKDCVDFEPKPDFLCPELDCFWRGETETALRRHTQTVHIKKISVISDKALKGVPKTMGKPKGVRCSECDALAYSRPLLLKHMTQIHGIEAPIMHRTFDDREELQNWLEQLRTTHAVEFVVSSGSKKWGFGLQVHYLTCSRSGEQKERPNKKFARPPRPSIKCGKNCMAYLKIKQNPVTSVLQVEGCLYHSGHMIDGTLIQLTPAEWRKVEAVAEQYERDQLAWEIDQDRLNLAAVRDVLGHFGRFRLIPDQQLSSLLKQWIKEYHEQTFKPEPVFPYPSAGLKYNTDSFDIIPTNIIPLLEDFDEYDSNSPASPIPCD